MVGVAGAEAVAGALGDSDAVRVGGGGAFVPTPRVSQVAGFAPWPPEGSGKARGKALRERTPRETHALHAPAAGRPSVATAVEEANAGRLPHLVPIRIGRMAASPFAFLRGSAGLMAHDLATTPATGLVAQLCGDAHAANFGLYGDARGRLAVDINDFDETVPGPWEWDLKRLAASLVLAGRQTGADEDTCRDAAFHAAGSYRRTMRRLAKLSALDAWNAIPDDQLVHLTDAHELQDVLAAVSAKALRNTSAKFAAKSTVRTEEGAWRFVATPPVLSEITDTRAARVAESLVPYRETVPAELQPLLARYSVQDIAFRIVGTGSVGTRSYVVLLLDQREQPLVLQVKEARASVLLPHLRRAGFAVAAAAGAEGHEGRRVVLGQKRMQVVSDMLMGWTTVDGLPYQVRQFRNRKGSVDPAALLPAQLDDYGRLTGALLARAHAHTADAATVAGYCGKDECLDEAIADFSVAYADQSEADHASLLAAIRSGRLPAEHGI